MKQVSTEEEVVEEVVELRALAIVLLAYSLLKLLVISNGSQ